MHSISSEYDKNLLQQHNVQIEVDTQGQYGVIILNNRHWCVTVLNLSAKNIDLQTMKLERKQIIETAEKTAVMLLKKQLLQLQEVSSNFEIKGGGIQPEGKGKIFHEDENPGKNTRADYNQLLDYLFHKNHLGSELKKSGSSESQGIKEALAEKLLMETQGTLNTPEIPKTEEKTADSLFSALSKQTVEEFDQESETESKYEVEQKLQTAVEKLQDSQKGIENLTREKTELQEQIQKLKQELKNKEKLIETATSGKKLSTNQFELLKEKLDKTDLELKDKIEVGKKQKTELENLVNSQKNLVKQLEDYERLKIEQVQLKNTLQTKSEKLKNKTDEFEKLKIENDHLNKKLKEQDAQLLSKQNRNTITKSDNEKLLKEIKTINLLQVNIEQQRKLSEEKLRKKEEEFKNLTDEQKSLTEEFKAISKALNTLEQKRELEQKLWNKEKEQLLFASNEKQKKIDKLRGDILDIKETLTDQFQIHELEEKNKLSSEKYNELQLLYDQSSKEWLKARTKLNQEITVLQNSLDDKELQMSDMKKEHIRNKQSVGFISTDQELKDANEAYNELYKDHDKLKSKYETQESELKNLNEFLTVGKNHILSQEEQIKTQQEEIQVLQDRIEKLQSQEKLLKQLNNQQIEQVKQLKNERDFYQGSEDEVKHREKKIFSLEEELNKSQTTITSQEKEISILEKRIQALGKIGSDLLGYISEDKLPMLPESIRDQISTAFDQNV